MLSVRFLSYCPCDPSLLSAMCCRRCIHGQDALILNIPDRLNCFPLQRFSTSACVCVCEEMWNVIPHNSINGQFSLCQDALVEVGEKYRKAMVSNAQLDNEKNNLMYQVDTLKDSLTELEELLAESRRECEDKAKVRHPPPVLLKEETRCRGLRSKV